MMSQLRLAGGTLTTGWQCVLCTLHVHKELVLNTAHVCGDDTLNRITITINSYCYPKLLAYLHATKI